MIFCSDISWDALYQRPQHLATRFARRRRLLWIEPAVIGHYPSRIPSRVADGIDRIVLPFFPFNARNGIVRAAAHMAGSVSFAYTLLDRLQSEMLATAIGRSEGPNGGGLAYLQNFQGLHAIQAQRPGTLVYDCIDNPFGFGPLPASVHRLWRETLDSADILLATSPSLAELINRTCGRAPLVVSNGVETSRFSAPHPRPADLPGRDAPVLGYVGSVYPWLDFPLLERLCLAFPAAHIVLIGKEHPDVRPRLALLSRFSNFRFLGYRPYENVPSYVKHFTVGLVPFLRNELTEGVNPVKLYEYAAAGIPVVSTGFSSDLTAFGPLIRVAGTTDTFIEATHDAIHRHADPEQRSALVSFAREHDWDRKADDIWRTIHPLPPSSS